MMGWGLEESPLQRAGLHARAVRVGAGQSADHSCGALERQAGGLPEPAELEVCRVLTRPTIILVVKHIHLNKIVIHGWPNIAMTRWRSGRECARRLDREQVAEKVDDLQGKGKESRVRGSETTW
jgi:hypothetical protein